MVRNNRPKRPADRGRNPAHVNPILAGMNLPLRALLEKYPPSRFDSDKAYFQFSLDLLRILAQHNTIETHGLTYEPVLLPRASQNRDGISHHAPPNLKDLDLAEMGLVLVDGKMIQEYLPTSHFDTKSVRSAFGKTTVVDPFYGIALLEAGGRWREYAFAVDDIMRQTRNNPLLEHHFFSNPGNILDTGLEICSAMLKDHLPAVARDGLTRHLMPEIQISSISEMHKWASDLQGLTVQYPKLKVWFRGQPTEYLMPDRSQAVARGALGHSRFRDASLVPSVYRGFHTHYADKTSLSRFLTSLVTWHDAARPIIGPEFEVVPLGQPPARPTLGDHAEFSSHFEYRDKSGAVIGGYTKHYHRQADFLGNGLLLQHYGCPTPCLDVTSNIDVAHWFATHGRGQKSLFEPISWSGLGPYIYVFLAAEGIHPIYDSTAIDLEGRSLRARRQQCGLIAGSGLLVQNFAARYIALKFRLDERIGAATAMSEDFLFPRPEDDNMLAALLNFEPLKKDRLFPLYGCF